MSADPLQMQLNKNATVGKSDANSSSGDSKNNSDSKTVKELLDAENSKKTVSKIRKGQIVVAVAYKIFNRNGDLKREQYKKSIMLYGTIALIAGLFVRNAWRSDEGEEQHQNEGVFKRLLEVISHPLLGLTIFALHKLRIGYKASLKLESEAARQIKENADLFPEDAKGDRLIFKNMTEEASLVLQKRGDFHFNEGKFDLKKRELLPKTIHRELFFLYEVPNSQSFGGKFADLDLLVDGCQDFRENQMYIAGELLYTTSSSNSILNILYTSLRKLDAYKKVFQQPKPSQNADLNFRVNYEISIINAYYSWIQVQAPEKNIKLLQNLEFVEVGWLLGHGKAVCRHRAFALAQLLQLAKKDNLLTGEIRFESRRPKNSKEGHTWLSYIIPGKDDRLVIDPQNNVLQFQSELTQDMKTFFEDYYRHPSAERTFNTLEPSNDRSKPH